MRRVIVILILVAAVIAAGWAGLRSIPYDVACDTEGYFESAPADHEALAKWVRSQPGVYLASENRELEKTGRWRVEIIFGISRNGWGRAYPI